MPKTEMQKAQKRQKKLEKKYDKRYKKITKLEDKIVEHNKKLAGIVTKQREVEDHITVLANQGKTKKTAQRAS